MHRHSQRDRPLISFDPEIEVIVRSQSGARKRQQQEVIMVERNPRVLQDYVLLLATDISSSIVNPTVEANNFELLPALVSFVEKDQFSGRPTESHPPHSPSQLPSEV